MDWDDETEKLSIERAVGRFRAAQMCACCLVYGLVAKCLFHLGSMGTLVLPREELNRVLRVLYLAFQAPIVVGWSAISGLCHYIAVGQTLNYPHFYLTTCSFKILFK